MNWYASGSGCANGCEWFFTAKYKTRIHRHWVVGGGECLKVRCCGSPILILENILFRNALATDPLIEHPTNRPTDYWTWSLGFCLYKLIWSAAFQPPSPGEKFSGSPFCFLPFHSFGSYRLAFDFNWRRAIKRRCSFCANESSESF